MLLLRRQLILLQLLRLRLCGAGRQLWVLRLRCSRRATVLHLNRQRQPRTRHERSQVPRNAATGYADHDVAHRQRDTGAVHLSHDEAATGCQRICRGLTLTPSGLLSKSTCGAHGCFATDA